MTIKNHRCSGGDDNRGKVTNEAMERAKHGWDDREAVVTTSDPTAVPAATAKVKEAELSSHF